MLALAAPIVVFGLVIFVHELGHFIAAKLCGVYAPRFSIGFGPALWRHRRGETEYVLAALPLGGYVRMASRHDAETAFIEGGNEETDALKPGDKGYDPNAMAPFGPQPVPADRWFESKSLPKRLFIMIAGVTMNVLLAFVVLTLLALTYGEPVVATRVVGAVHPPASAPSLAQLLPGDTIVAVGGEAVQSWNDIGDRIDNAPAGTLAIRTSRGEVRVPVGTAGAPTSHELAAAIDFFIPPVIGEVLPGSPASTVGLKPGDSVVAIGHAPVHGWADLQALVSSQPGVALPFDIVRRGKAMTLVVRPEAQAANDSVKESAKTPGRVARGAGRIGASPADNSARVPVGLGRAMASGARGTWLTAGKIVGVVKGLLTREVSVRQLGGPIAITRASVAAAKSGLESLFFLIAILSVNVAVLNLLPIPILDGGQILINVAESAKGSPFSARAREYILRAGLGAILLIFAMSTFNDVVNGFRDAMARLFG